MNVSAFILSQRALAIQQGNHLKLDNGAYLILPITGAPLIEAPP